MKGKQLFHSLGALILPRGGEGIPFRVHNLTLDHPKARHEGIPFKVHNLTLDHPRQGMRAQLTWCQPPL